VNSGHIGNAAVTSGSIASGQVGKSHLSSGAVNSGHIATTGAPDGTKFLRDDFTWSAVASLSSGAVQSGHIASGAVQGFFGSTRHIASGTVGSFDLGSGAIASINIASGVFNAYPKWAKITKTYINFNTTGSGRTWDVSLLYSGLPYTTLHGIKINVDELFVASGLTNYQMSLGEASGGNAVLYAPLTNLMSGTLYLNQTLAGGDLTDLQVYATVYTSGVNIEKMSGGQVSIWLLNSITE
jgi:hypothetical protein